MTRRLIALATFFLLATLSAGAAATTTLTADEVARRARDTSFDVKARADERVAAEAAVTQALAAYLPRLTGMARYTRLSTVAPASLGNIVVAPSTPSGSTPDPTRLVAMPLQFASIPNQYVAQATLQVPLSDYLLRLPQAHAAAAGSARASALTEKAARLRVASEARVAYYTWLRARSQVRIAEQAGEQARGHLADVRHAAEADAASPADVLRVEAQVAAAELLLARARSFAAVSETQLRTLMHDASAEPYDSAEDLAAAAATDVPEARALDLLWSEAAGRRLELRALAENESAARQQAKVALSAGLPRLDAVGNAVYADPNPRIFPQDDRFRGTWDATVQLSWTPTDLPVAQAARRAALARAAQVADLHAALVDGIKLEVTQAAQALAEARVAVGTAGRGLEAAEESRRVRRVLFQNARATSMELTDAETELTRARMDLVAAQIDLRVAHARLVHALGRDVD